MSPVGSYISPLREVLDVKRSMMLISLVLVSLLVLVGCPPTLINKPPEWTKDLSFTVEEGQKLEINLNEYASDPNEDRLKFSIEDEPEFVSLDGATLTIAPTFTDAGTYTFTVYVTDEKSDPVGATATVVVKNHNLPPVWEEPSMDIEVLEGDLVKEELPVYDPDGDDFTVYMTPDSTVGTVVEESGKWYYEWQTTLEDEGEYTVKLYAVDSGGATSDMFTINITVRHSNATPTWSEIPTLEATEGKEIKLNLLEYATDTDDSTLTFGILDAPIGQIEGESTEPGHYWIDVSGVFHWIPSYDFVESGEATNLAIFEFFVSDGFASDTISIQIVVYDFNHLPKVSLNSPENGSLDVSLFPTFKWTVEDPDLPYGDEIVWYLYLNDKEFASGTVSGESSVVSVEYDSIFALDYNTKYTWRVIVSDKSNIRKESKEYWFVTTDKFYMTVKLDRNTFEAGEEGVATIVVSDLEASNTYALDVWVKIEGPVEVESATVVGSTLPIAKILEDDDGTYVRLGYARDEGKKIKSGVIGWFKFKTKDVGKEENGYFKVDSERSALYVYDENGEPLIYKNFEAKGVDFKVLPKYRGELSLKLAGEPIEDESFDLVIHLSTENPVRIVKLDWTGIGDGLTVVSSEILVDSMTSGPIDGGYLVGFEDATTLDCDILKLTLSASSGNYNLEFNASVLTDSGEKLYIPSEKLNLRVIKKLNGKLYVDASKSVRMWKEFEVKIGGEFEGTPKIVVLHIEGIPKSSTPVGLKPEEVKYDEDGWTVFFGLEGSVESGDLVTFKTMLDKTTDVIVEATALDDEGKTFDIDPAARIIEVYFSKFNASPQTVIVGVGERETFNVEISDLATNVEAVVLTFNPLKEVKFVPVMNETELATYTDEGFVFIKYGDWKIGDSIEIPVTVDGIEEGYACTNITVKYIFKGAGGDYEEKNHRVCFRVVR